MARATDTHAELIKRRRDVNPARGTPDGILMSGVSSPLSDSPSDALMPSKCTLPTFSCVSRPRPPPRDSWLRRGVARVGVVDVGRFFDALVEGIHVKGSSSFGRMCALFVDSCFSCVGCVQFVETVSSESYKIVESARFPGILSEQWVYFKPFTLERNRLHILLFLSCLSLVMAFEELNVSLHII